MGHRLSQPFTFDRTVRLIITTVLLCASIYLLYELRGVLLPFLVAWLFAYMLNPVVRFFKRKLKFPNGLAVLTTLLLVVGILTALGFLLVPLIEKEIWQINTIISNYNWNNFSTEDGTMLKLADIINRYVDFQAIRDGLSKDSVIEAIEYISPVVQSLLSNTIAFVVGFTIIFITILYLIFILIDYEKINELWRFLVPPKHRTTVFRIADDVERNMNNYFRHQALICLILAVLYATGFYIVGLPLAIGFGIIVGLVHMVPYLQVITFPPAILLCWLQASQSNQSFWVILGLVAIVYVVNQIIMDGFLVPKIMGKVMGLNPAIILLSLSVWGALLGIVGMIIAIPLTTLLLSYYKVFIQRAERVMIIESSRKANKAKTEAE